MKEDYFSGKDDALEKAYRTSYLIAGFIKQNLTIDEHDELDDWVAASDENMQLFEELTNEKNIQKTLDWFKSLNTEQELQETKQKIQFTRPAVSNSRKLLYYAAAASIIVIAGAYFFLKPSKDNFDQRLVVHTNNDISPGTDKATLTISEKSPISLDSTTKELLAQSGITNTNGKIMYDSSLASAAESHLLQVPRKGRYQLLLPDGSQVWLNAASSIKYPNVFKEKERRVEITGEVFFNVASDRSRPFVVLAGNMAVMVIGTSFNINAYENEPTVCATLVEGTVKLIATDNEAILKPGQQGRVTKQNTIEVANVDLDEAVAWKNNRFKFTNMKLESIMRQVERWYDIDVEYQEEITHHFNGTISREEPLSGLLSLLEGTGRVHFKLQGKKLYVMR